MTTSAAHPNPPGPAHPPTDSAASKIQVYCLKCNHPNPWDTRFCGQCGVWLGDAKEAAIVQANRLVASHPDLHTVSHDRSVGFYFTVFLGLGLATVTEILSVSFLPLHWMKVTGLVVMAIIKFLLVAMFFMHLKGDKRFYTVFFCVGFFFAAGVLLALQALFHL